jgi:ABC-type dipeptide/oligopeptide/nickel transport system permease component
MQQVFLCPKCGSVVIFGSAFCGRCGNALSWQQQPAIQPSYQKSINYQQQDDMNWFQRHLNWTFVLGFFAMFVLAFIIGIFIVVANLKISDSWIQAVMQILAIVVMLTIGGWVLKQKGRSLWWLLLAGWFSPVWLGNKNK